MAIRLRDLSGSIGSGSGVSTASSGISSFSPSDISGLRLWLKADAITGLADGAAVNTWSDSSGQGLNATAVNAATYKTGIVNGKPIVRFDGSNDAYTLGASLQFASISMFVVFRRTGNIISTCILSNTNNGTGGWALGISDGSQNVPKWYLGGNTVEGTALTVNAATVLGATFDSGTAFLYQNNTQVGTLTSQPAFSYDANNVLILGALYESGAGVPTGQFTAGDVAEVIAYNKLVSSTERGQIQSYLASKYGIS